MQSPHTRPILLKLLAIALELLHDWLLAYFAFSKLCHPLVSKETSKQAGGTDMSALETRWMRLYPLVRS